MSRTKPERACGQCKYYIAHHAGSLLGDCYCPLPASIKNSETECILYADERAKQCGCFEYRTEPPGGCYVCKDWNSYSKGNSAE
jgi:hypothetical protein